MGSSNAEKWGDHQKKKFFVKNSIEAVISFKEEYQGLLKLHVPFRFEEGGGSSVAKHSGESSETSFTSQISTSF